MRSFTTPAKPIDLLIALFFRLRSSLFLNFILISISAIVPLEIYQPHPPPVPSAPMPHADPPTRPASSSLPHRLRQGLDGLARPQWRAVDGDAVPHPISAGRPVLETVDERRRLQASQDAIMETL